MLPQSVVTFYACEDTRTPFRMALWISSVDIAFAAACHLLLPPRWAVTGMAAAYALSYVIGLLLTALCLQRRTEGLLDGRRICRTYASSLRPLSPPGVRVAHRPLLQPEPGISLLGSRAFAGCGQHRDGPAVPALCTDLADRGAAQPARAGMNLAPTKSAPKDFRSRPLST